jgi:hypothetical protein
MRTDRRQFIESQVPLNEAKSLHYSVWYDQVDTQEEEVVAVGHGPVVAHVHTPGRERVRTSIRAGQVQLMGLPSDIEPPELRRRNGQEPTTLDMALKLLLGEALWALSGRVMWMLLGRAGVVVQ